jgi:hypothetical protein
LPEEEKKKILDAKNAKKQAIIDKINIKPKIIDNEDGTYTVRYKVPEECKCEIKITYKEDNKEENIRGHRFVSSFVAKGNAKLTNEFDGTLMNNHVTSILHEIAKFLEHTKENIEIRNKPITEDVNELLKVMMSLKDLEERRDEIFLSMERIEEVLKTFEKKHDKKKEAEMKKSLKLIEDTKTINHIATRVEK